ncbi:MAG: sulfur carrier protein ThiS [Acidobacteriota bacterium]
MTATSLTIEVNGEPMVVQSGDTVASVVSRSGRDPRAVAVEYNGEILPRDRYQGTALALGDRIEIVHFVQGG